MTSSGLRAAVLNLVLFAAAMLVTLGILELVLRSGLTDQVDRDRPIWIPPRLHAVDDSINALHLLLARRNPWGFTDVSHAIDKPPGTYRIAVLGDSFVWGDGLPPGHSWGFKLAGLIRSAGFDSVEVMQWGRNGWSTRDEVGYYLAGGRDFHPDLVILSWVSNDPHVIGGKERLPQWQNRTVALGFRLVFPNVHAFLSDGINRLIERLNKAYGYDNWEQSLYSPENLGRYAYVLRDLRVAVDGDLLAVLLASNTSERLQQKLDLIKPMFDEAEIPYLDLQPFVAREYGGRTNRELWANPANAHPGEELTDLYARVTFEYIRPRFLEKHR